MGEPGYDCWPTWCGGTADDPCPTARQTDNQLHEDELDAFYGLECW